MSGQEANDAIRNAFASLHRAYGTGFGKTPAAEPPMSLEEQLRRIMPHMECPEVFLAGVRFAQGFAEYGDALMTMSDDALELARMEEHADQLVYEAEQMARKAAD